MGEWIALIDSLIWPLFLAVFLLCSRDFVKSIFKSIHKRIAAGEQVSLGPSGFTLGLSENKLTRNDEVKEAIGEAVFAATAQTDAAGKKDESKQFIVKDAPHQFEKVIYLIHSVSAPRIDTDGVERRGINVIVDADSEKILDEIERVVYHLHPTFPNPDRESVDRERHFVLNTKGWGEFNLFADVYFKGYENPLRLFRYINFQNY